MPIKDLLPTVFEMTFDDWMAEVDHELIVRCGMASDDLPDYHYHDMYDEDAAPKVAAEESFMHAFFS